MADGDWRNGWVLEAETNHLVPLDEEGKLCARARRPVVLVRLLQAREGRMNTGWVVLKHGVVVDEVEVLDRLSASSLVTATFDGCSVWRLTVRRTGREDAAGLSFDCATAMAAAYCAVLGMEPVERLADLWSGALEKFWSDRLLPVEG